MVRGRNVMGQDARTTVADSTRRVNVERELTAAVDLCLPNGRLNPAATGWSRRPLHRCNLSGRWPRKKRWDFWGVTTDTHMFAITYGGTDYVGVVTVSFLDYAAGKRVEHTRLLPLARGMRFPDTVGGGDLRFSAPDLQASISEESGGTRLAGAFHTRNGRRLEAEVLVARPPGHESLNVVIPWSATCFQFTSKQNTRPATGTAVLDGTTYRFGPENQAYGCLDYGRGIWPYDTVWNWASASGRQGGRVVGLNLGGQWTDGTGATENGLCIDGVLHKIGEDLVWEYDRRDFRRPWRIRAPQSGRVDLEVVPRVEESARLDLLLVRTELHWVLGDFHGTVVGDSGERWRLDGLTGWAEEHRARW